MYSVKLINILRAKISPFKAFYICKNPDIYIHILKDVFVSSKVKADAA